MCFNEIGIKIWAVCFAVGYGPMVGSCESANEPYGSTEGGVLTICVTIN
jgi:hypothetical protein